MTWYTMCAGFIVCNQSGSKQDTFSYIVIVWTFNSFWLLDTKSDGKNINITNFHILAGLDSVKITADLQALGL